MNADKEELLQVNTAFHTAWKKAVGWVDPASIPFQVSGIKNVVSVAMYEHNFADEAES